MCWGGSAWALGPGSSEFKCDSSSFQLRGLGNIARRLGIFLLIFSMDVTVPMCGGQTSKPPNVQTPGSCAYVPGVEREALPL